ncbi:EG45-like domain containing protein isoform X2 [Jatropha curcas]|nr:EG45-like domain containing protein isoform X2 [Jatropha curcas]
MDKPQQPSYLLFLFLLAIATLFPVSHGDVGTAAHYSPPYLPTACYGNDESQFPSSNLFAAASEGIWDNGAACGRQYLVRCISAVAPNTCNREKIIRVRIVDRAQTSVSRPSRNGATIILSDIAFAQIASPSVSSVNVEFQQV